MPEQVSYLVLAELFQQALIAFHRPGNDGVMGGEPAFGQTDQHFPVIPWVDRPGDQPVRDQLSQGPADLSLVHADRIGQSGDAHRRAPAHRGHEPELYRGQPGKTLVTIGGGGPGIIPCNWLQYFENVIDPYHVPVLKNDYGTDAVRYSLLSAAVTTTLGALLFALAAQSIRADIRRAA